MRTFHGRNSQIPRQLTQKAPVFPAMTWFSVEFAGLQDWGKQGPPVCLEPT